jgi:transposase, IS5 family
LNYDKKKKKTESVHRKMTRKLLECIKRDIKHINTYLDSSVQKDKEFPLSRRDQHFLWIINTVYGQQKGMFDAGSHSCPDRIVSIFQPHVRPIPRGKTKAQIEFGSKLGVSLDDGFARINTLSWDAYHEGGDLIGQVEAYKEVHGYYPELVQVDKIYATRENRQWLKERGIRITASPLGRRKEKGTETYYQKRKRRKEAAERNHIEGKFGQGKNGYRLNEIRARLKDTSESWIACIFFIMNLIHYEKKNIFGIIFRRLINEQMRIFFQMRKLVERFIESLNDLETGKRKIIVC